MTEYNIIKWWHKRDYPWFRTVQIWVFFSYDDDNGEDNKNKNNQDNKDKKK